MVTQYIYLKNNNGASDADQYGNMLLQQILKRLFTALQNQRFARQLYAIN